VRRLKRPAAIAVAGDVMVDEHLRDPPGGRFGGDGQHRPAHEFDGSRPGLRWVVRELERSVRFYRELLALEVAVHDNTAALLVSPDGFELYLRSMGPGAHHSLGSVGIQYLIWTADGEDDLRRCEQVLRAWSDQVTRQSIDGFTVVEGRGPDNVPVLVTHPGPDEGAAPSDSATFLPVVTDRSPRREAGAPP
jgi:catechol 2,3-dioxygenase-like lactoylglutathione lyase family enzyme